MKDDIKYIIEAQTELGMLFVSDANEYSEDIYNAMMFNSIDAVDEFCHHNFIRDYKMHEIELFIKILNTF